MVRQLSRRRDNLTFSHHQEVQGRTCEDSIRSSLARNSPNSVNGPNCNRIAFDAFSLTDGSCSGPSNSTIVATAVVAACVNRPTAWEVISERISDTRLRKSVVAQIRYAWLSEHLAKAAEALIVSPDAIDVASASKNLLSLFICCVLFMFMLNPIPEILDDRQRLRGATR